MPIKIYKREVDKTKDHAKTTAYSQKQRLKVVTMYLMSGNMAAVAAATGIPHDRIRQWKMQDWWKEMEEEIRRGHNLKTSNSLKKIIDRSFKVLNDRIENGDYMFDPKTGTFRRRPINAKTAADIATKALDREMMLQKIEEKPKVQEEQIMDRLKNIESALLRAAKQRKGEVIDVEPIEEDLGLIALEIPEVESDPGTGPSSSDSDSNSVASS
jgi:hypothetical protein